jgi:predicted signal transduction protein with EAL and GGDEF domain
MGRLRSLVSARPSRVRPSAIGFAAVGMAAPAVLLLMTTSRVAGPAGPAWALSALAILCSLICLAILARLLRPIDRAAAALELLKVKLGYEEALPVEADDLQTLAGGVERLAGRFDVMRQRLMNQHPGTGFPTREPFLADLAADMERSDAPSLLALIRFCDFDRMASFDRRAAEAALVAFGARLKGSARGDLSMAQVDRDCFAIWFGATPPDAAATELRAIAYVLEEDLGPGEQKIAPTVSLSAALYPHDAQAPAALLACAFAALPKGEGPQASGLAFFSSSSSEAARRRFLLEQGLHGAAGREEFTLNFQPIVDVALGRVVGAEALIRWRHPELGAVSPAEFIPVLEQSGQIEDVGQWVLHAACREARAWRQQGLTDLKIAVNVSTRQFRSASLAASVLRALERHRLTPQDLEVELTETAAMQDSTHTRQALEQLRALGVGVAIDDFGAGYSNLSYLKNLPFTKLKIDREFVTQAHVRPDSRAICAALITLGRGLNIRVLAEGVEEQAEVDTLVELGCTLFQGYHFARPLTAAKFVETLNDADWLRRLAIAPAEPKPARKRA